MIYKPQDWVSLKDSILTDTVHRVTTPVALVKIGWPNRFQVLRSGMVDGKEHLEIDPCCHHMKWPPSYKEVRCKCHPVDIFRKADPVEPRGFEHHHKRVMTPWGPLVELEYIHGSNEAALAVKIPGFDGPIFLNGDMARELGDRLKEGGFLNE